MTMTENMPDERRIVQSVLLWQFRQNRSERQELTAIESVFGEHPEFEEFISKQKEEYREYAERHGYQPSWDWWVSIIRSRVWDEFGRERLVEWCEEQLECDEEKEGDDDG